MAWKEFWQLRKRKAFLYVALGNFVVGSFINFTFEHEAFIFCSQTTNTSTFKPCVPVKTEN